MLSVFGVVPHPCMGSPEPKSEPATRNIAQIQASSAIYRADLPLVGPRAGAQEEVLLAMVWEAAGFRGI